GRVKDHVIEAIVAMHDRDALLLRQRPRQPLDQLLDFRNVLGLRGAVLLGPAVDLAREIISGAAEISEADLFGIEIVQMRQRLDLAREDFPTRLRRLARQRGIPEHAALFHRHDVEGGADHAVVGAERIGARHRKALLGQRGDDAELAVDRMRRRQQFAERLAAHHVRTAGRIEPIGRVGLAALELQDGQRALIAFDIPCHPAVEADLIDPMPFLDRLGAGKFLVLPDAVGQLALPLYYTSFRGAQSAKPEPRDSGFDAIASPRNDGVWEAPRTHFPQWLGEFAYFRSSSLAMARL